MPDQPLVSRTFFDRPVLEVAPDLLGCFIEHASAEGIVRVRLTEVEAYDGRLDPGSHAFRGRTKRNDVMFGPPGHVYVYFTYGMHWCMNLVCGAAGVASAVLLRAGEVVAGAELAQAWRTSSKQRHDLARGPARLTVALGIDGRFNGADATDPHGAIRVFSGSDRTLSVRTGPRVGVAGEGAQQPWRFWIDADPTVSTYRPAITRRRRGKSSGTLGTAAAEPATAPARPRHPEGVATHAQR